MSRFARVAALAAAALMAVGPMSAARAQTGDSVPFEEFLTSAECTTGERRDPGLAVSGLDRIVTSVDPVPETRTARVLDARTLGRSLLESRRGRLPLGDVIDRAGHRYAAAPVRGGTALFRITGKRVHVLQVASGSEDATGDAVWLPILQVDLNFLDRAARTSDATTWGSLGDVVVDGDRLYVSVPEEHRVFAVSLDDGKDRFGRRTARVWTYVEADVNAPWAFAPPTSEDSFTFPSALGLDADGSLYIAEMVSGDPALKTRGDDLWVATRADDGEAAPAVGRFATLERCDARLLGVEVDPSGTIYLRIARSHFFFGLALKN